MLCLTIVTHILNKSRKCQVSIWFQPITLEYPLPLSLMWCIATTEKFYKYAGTFSYFFYTSLFFQWILQYEHGRHVPAALWVRSGKNCLDQIARACRSLRYDADCPSRILVSLNFSTGVIRCRREVSVLELDKDSFSWVACYNYLSLRTETRKEEEE